MDRSHVDLTYEDALDLRHELVNAACIEVVHALQSLDNRQKNNELEDQMAALEEHLIELGKEKAQLFALLSDYRVKLSGTE
jgi:thymidine phosphorylase